MHHFGDKSVDGIRATIFLCCVRLASSNVDDKHESLLLWDSDGEDYVPEAPPFTSHDPLSTPDDAQVNHSAQNRPLHYILPGYSQLGLCSMFEHVSEQNKNGVSAAVSGNNPPLI